MKPGPTLTGLTGEWYGFLAVREIRFQRCTGCGRWRHPPRVGCAGCGSPDWSWERSSGRGEVYSWTVTHQAVHPDWAADAPYAIVVVALEEPGVRLVSGWDGPLSALGVGVGVVVGFQEREDGLVVPVCQVNVAS